jgi:chromosome segregation ATPase
LDSVAAASCAALSCRNNTSDYYVSGKRMNVKEVTTLLKGKGIDLDNNRFLILQVRA